MNFLTAFSIVGGLTVGVAIGHAISKYTETTEKTNKNNENTIKVFISVPMNGRTNENIFRDMDNAKIEIKKQLPDKDIEFVHNFIGEEELKSVVEKNIPMYCMAKAVEKMANCDYIYFCDGWVDARGCRVEKSIAESYGLKTIY